MEHVLCRLVCHNSFSYIYFLNGFIFVPLHTRMVVSLLIIKALQFVKDMQCLMYEEGERSLSNHGRFYLVAIIVRRKKDNQSI